MAGIRAPGALLDFVKIHREVEGVIQHVGRETWDLLLIDVDGDWVRDEFSSKERAEAACRDLGVRWHDRWDDPRMTRRMSRGDPWSDPGGRRRAL